MPALNFSSTFAIQVANGTKHQTIRKLKKHPIVPGDHLILYTGMRTKNCRKLREVVCSKVIPIVIKRSNLILQNDICLIRTKTCIYVNGKYLSPKDQIALAAADGFNSVSKFIAWFKNIYGIPFEGNIIIW